MDVSGARFVPIVNFTHDDDDTHSRVCEIPKHLAASVIVSVGHFCIGDVLTNCKGDPVQNVQSSADPKWDQRESLAIAVSRTCPQSAPEVLRPQAAVQLVSQRAREALTDQRETGRRTLLNRQR